MGAKVSIPDLDFEYKLWKNRLGHYIREIKIYVSRLQSVRTETTVLVDRLIRDFNEINEAAHGLCKEIKVHEEEIAYYKKDYPISRDHQHFADHEAIRQKFQRLEKQYDVLVGRINREVKALYLV